MSARPRRRVRAPQSPSRSPWAARCKRKHWHAETPLRAPRRASPMPVPQGLGCRSRGHLGTRTGHRGRCRSRVERRPHSIPRGPDNVQNDLTFSVCLHQCLSKNVLCRLLAWWWSPPLTSSSASLLCLLLPGIVQFGLFLQRWCPALLISVSPHPHIYYSLAL